MNVRCIFQLFISLLLSWKALICRKICSEKHSFQHILFAACAQTIENLTVYCFGHLVYEMSTGKPLDTVHCDNISYTCPQELSKSMAKYVTIFFIFFKLSIQMKLECNIHRYCKLGVFWLLAECKTRVCNTLISCTLKSTSVYLYDIVKWTISYCICFITESNYSNKMSVY